MAKSPAFSEKSTSDYGKGKLDYGIFDMIRAGGRKFLSALKRKSLRSHNSWYRILSLDKRRFIDAVIQTVDKIQSTLLLKILTQYTQKLLPAIGGVRGLIGPLAYRMQTYGRPLAQKISKLAEDWGNSMASKWAKDTRFIRYLSVNQTGTSQFSTLNQASDFQSQNILPLL